MQQTQTTSLPPEYQVCLAPTAIIDSDHPRVKEYALRVAEGAKDDLEAAVKLYLAVRDNIRYDPYGPFDLPEHYRASYVLDRGKHFCIPKAALLCALLRAFNIPSRLGFANVKNHLATSQLLEYVGADVFVYHAFTEIYLHGAWVKATPAFNRELCKRHGVSPLDFNGREDSLFQPYNQKKQHYMEYVELIGTYPDVPLDEILLAWRKELPPEYESRGLTRDGRTIWVSRRNTVISYRGKPAILGNIVETTPRKQIEQSLQESQKELRLLSAQLLAAQENERKWVAQELHDSIGQTLAAAKFSLERRISQMDIQKAPAGVLLENILALIQNGIEETRTIMMTLRPSILDDLGILATINCFCREFQRIYTPLQVHRNLRVEEKDIPAHLKIAS